MSGTWTIGGTNLDRLRWEPQILPHGMHAWFAAFRGLHVWIVLEGHHRFRLWMDDDDKGIFRTLNAACDGAELQLNALYPEP